MTFDDLLERLKRYPIPSICGTAVVLCALVLYFRMDAISELETRLDEVTTESNQMADNLLAGSNLAEHINTIRTLASELDTRIVRQADLAENLKYFYRIESETGVSLADLRQTVPSSKSGGGKQPFAPVGYSLILSGSFPQVIAYFDELENGKRFYRLSNFNLQRGRDLSQSSVMLALNLELLGWP